MGIDASTSSYEPYSRMDHQWHLQDGAIAFGAVASAGGIRDRLGGCRMQLYGRAARGESRSLRAAGSRARMATAGHFCHRRLRSFDRSPSKWKPRPRRQCSRMGAYDMPGLIDLALTNNPDTRRMWEAARAAAANYGISKAPFYPMVSAEASGGYSRMLFELPNETAVLRQWQITPMAELTYTLLDFGRRSASAEVARQQLAAANFGFNRACRMSCSMCSEDFTPWPHRRRR